MVLICPAGSERRVSFLALLPSFEPTDVYDPRQPLVEYFEYGRLLSDMYPLFLYVMEAAIAGPTLRFRRFWMTAPLRTAIQRALKM